MCCVFGRETGIDLPPSRKSIQPQAPRNPEPRGGLRDRNGVPLVDLNVVRDVLDYLDLNGERASVVGNCHVYIPIITKKRRGTGLSRANTQLSDSGVLLFLVPASTLSPLEAVMLKNSICNTQIT